MALCYVRKLTAIEQIIRVMRLGATRVRQCRAIDIVEQIWRSRPADAPELSDDEALRLRDEQHAFREGR